MLTLLFNPSQIVTVNTDGKNYKRGVSAGNLDVLEDHSLVMEDGIIKDFLPNSSVVIAKYDSVMNLQNKTVLPGLIDCHTHTAYAGSRADEFRLKTSGVSYEEIARYGGGITRTVSAVREKNFDELIKIVRPRVENFVSQGITTLEIKSGYGLSFEDEVKQLQVIRHLKENCSIDIIPTFLGAHTFPKEYSTDHEGYVRLITEKMLPYIAENRLAEFCDAFCELTAFSVEETQQVLAKAQELGLKTKLHTDQFNSIGGVDTALRNNCVSVDHLEAVSREDITKLSHTETVCVLLPGASFFSRYPYAPARTLISSGAIVALSTDYNPGSSHISSLGFIMSLSAIEMQMSIEETISAVTINAARALGVHETTGSLEIGKKADFAIFDTPEYADIVYNVGNNLNCITIKNGKTVYTS